MIPCFTHWLVAALFLLGAAPLRAETLVRDAKAGISVEVKPVFEEIPTFGMAPFRVEIENHGSTPGVWEFRWRSPRWGSPAVETRQLYRVEPGQKRVFQCNVPLQGDGKHLGLNASGTALPPAQYMFGHQEHGRGADTPMLAFGPDIAARSWEPLRTAASKKESKAFAQGALTLHGTPFILEDLPDQWEAYSGIEWLFLSEAEWARLPAPVRNAVRQWVGMGGALVVAARAPAQIAWPGGGAGGSQPYGSGAFHAIEWDGRELSPERIVTLVGRQTQVGRHVVAPEWPTVAGLADLTPPRTLIIVAGLVLAGVFGPLNLLVLAPKRRRYRLFWTTPLLALGGSAVLIACILVVDGSGGRGGRVTVWNFLPDAPEAAVHQAQMARTGLLFSSRFTMEGPVVARPIPVEKRGSGDGVHRVEGGDRFSGGWFRSRSVQALWLSTLRPTREGLTLFAEGEEAVSRFGAPLSEIYLADGEGRYWKAARAATGERVALEPLPRDAFIAVWRRVKDTFPATLQSRSLGPDTPGPVYFARMSGGAVETLPSIRWKGEEVWAVGRLETAKGGPR